MRILFLVIILLGGLEVQGQALNIKFVSIPGGVYQVGSDESRSNKKRQVDVSSFDISMYEITNAQFKTFIDCTNYVTLAERLKNSQVFLPNIKEYHWVRDTTANWRYPQGLAFFCVDSMPNYPVTGIAMQDAMAFCQWAKMRLPTLDEWEIACRAGTSTTYYWGEDTSKINNYANIWMGKSHSAFYQDDPYCFAAPVGSFMPNQWGLYDMLGNVFELCSGSLPSDKKYTVHARGGSWWCSLSTCGYFNAINIGGYHKKASFSNIGFRVVKEISTP